MRNPLVFIAIFLCYTALLFSEETFLLIDGASGKHLVELGPSIYKRFSPCSTFKIALSLIGFDTKILKTPQNPIWDFQEGYDDFLEMWKQPQTPETWMKTSCVWYSKVLAEKIDTETLQTYLAHFDYGNQDLSAGVTKAWLNASLTISAKEQVSFLQKMLSGSFSLSSDTFGKTKALLFQEPLPEGWHLYGKTGWGKTSTSEIGWFVGWIEKEGAFFPFAYHILENKIDLSRRIPRAKELINSLYVSEHQALPQLQAK